MRKAYFPGLQALRFYAALSVIFHHFTAPNTWFGDSSALAYAFRFGFMEGQNAVTLFFVLSGFLILYLLLKERVETGTVRVGRFYLRRAFRILPLYYLTLSVSVLIVIITYPNLPLKAQQAADNPINWITALLYCFNLLGIVALPISHLWSLNIEEQFYLFAPHLIKRARSIPGVLIGFIIVKLTFQLACLAAFRITGNGLLQYVYEMLVIMRFECMALGGLAAWLVYKEHTLLKLVWHPVTQAITVIGFAGIVFFGTSNDLLFNSGSSLVYALLILNLVSAPRFMLRFESPVLKRLGDLSYSMYMVHQGVIWILWIGGVRGIAYPVLSVVLSIGLSYALYRWFETPFLTLRERFALVQSSQSHEARHLKRCFIGSIISQPFRRITPATASVAPIHAAERSRSRRQSSTCSAHRPALFSSGRGMSGTTRTATAASSPMG
jgi:peptidoglycan/LPS O-acetylase OafA/YrhL